MSASIVAVALLVGCVYGVLGRDSGQRYRLVFESSSQVVKGGTVRIGGTQVGTVKSIDLTKDDRAAVEISVSGDFAPLRRGATAVVRAQGTAGVASRYVDISPGSGLEPALADGATIPVDHTTSQVELDQLFASVDGRTRSGLRRTIRGFSEWYAGREAEGGKAARRLPKGMAALRTFAAEVDAQTAQFARLIGTSSRTMSTLAGEQASLTRLVGGAASTVDALGADTGALTGVLRDTPAMLRQGTAALASLRGTLPDLRRLLDASDTPSKRLPRALDDLRPVLTRATPVVGQLRRVVDLPGAGNDLLDGLRDLPAVDRSARTAFPASVRALAGTTPILSYARPYTPDLVSWLGSFGRAAAAYDADGHYLTAMPTFDAYRTREDDQGGTLVPKAPAERGTDAALSTGHTKRCPGTAAGTLPDGSGAFVDRGALANADCDAGEGR
ncbi:MlaD family protein [Patulibacter minatonensis]|uniref:MlaD family protein n=1 Tax=Patulibacter minatonensis TaxID=298163 RepID=UPI00047D7F65|nr:MlaD family protein [Patulibacter minatonensis]